MRLSLAGLIVAVTLASVHSQSSDQRLRPRTIVTTDPELDDSNSPVRFLLYSAEVETEGLIYASSQFHWRGDGKGTLFSMPARVFTRGYQLVPLHILDGSRANTLSTMPSMIKSVLLDDEPGPVYLLT